MNCKPGDFAMIVAPHQRPGVLVSVVEDCSAEDLNALSASEPDWLKAGHIWACRLIGGSSGVDIEALHSSYLLPGDEVWVADQFLRPIRDPGDDAVDETLQRLPAPIIQPEIKEDKSEVAHG